MKNGQVKLENNIEEKGGDINNTVLINKVGEINYNKYKSKMTIVEYYGLSYVVVEFDNGYITKCTYQQFKKGTIKSLYCRTVCGVGIVGLQNIQPNNDEIYKKSYDRWRSMLTRCYNENELDKAPTYKGVTVCKEWLYYPNFKKWYDENFYEAKGEQMCLDKDILCKGNKIYSPRTCIFVPARINTMFTQNNKRRGDCPIGVNYKKKTNKYIAQCNNGSHSNAGLGTFDNPIDAFYKYKDYKEKSIRIVANEFRDRIPEKLFNAMYNWVVEIDD